MPKHRWVCPECSVGKLLPSRLAKEDARSVCVPCTSSALQKAKGGKAVFVRLVCPTKENQRKQKAEQRRTKAAADAVVRKQQREAAKEAADRVFFREGVDLRKELRRFEKLLKINWAGILVLKPSRYLWGFKRGPGDWSIHLNGNSLLDCQLCIIFGLVNLRHPGRSRRKAWKKEVVIFCNKHFGIRMNWELNPRVIPTKRGRVPRRDLLREAKEQIRLKSLEFPEFMGELREAVYQDKPSRARLMGNLVAPGNRQVVQDYTDKHF